jgi:hypothetical protein
MDGKTGTGMSIESSSADVVGVDMVIRELLLRNKGGDDDDDDYDDDDNGCVRNGRRLHGERLGGEEIRGRREDKIGCEQKMWGDRGSINMGPAKLMPVWVGLPWVCI